MQRQHKHGCQQETRAGDQRLSRHGFRGRRRRHALGIETPGMCMDCGSATNEARQRLLARKEKLSRILAGIDAQLARM